MNEQILLFQLGSSCKADLSAFNIMEGTSAKDSVRNDVLGP
jgi:hypothetical protein